MLEMYGYGFLLSLTGYLGVNLVLTLVRVAGAFAAVTVMFTIQLDSFRYFNFNSDIHIFTNWQVTTCRKALSIIVSFIFFTKPFTIQ